MTQRAQPSGSPLPSTDQQAGQLKAIMDSEGLDLVFQPKFNCARGTVCGVEVLARWPGASAPWQRPDCFIRLAEREGLAPELDLHVLKKALRQLARLPAQTRRALKTVSINVSAVSAQDARFLQSVKGLLSSRPHPKLMFELTETAPIHQLSVVRKGFEALSHYGIDLSLDDFLCGHATLNLLTALPVREIKIDKRDVARLDTPAGYGRVAGLIDLARQGEISVTAEGVETREQWQALRALGCDSAQGFWLSRPLPLAEVVTLIGQLHEDARAVRPDLWSEGVSQHRLRPRISRA